MKNGFNSVMYDGSALSYEENTANTQAIVKIAHAMGVSVEAELGYVGSEDGSADELSIEEQKKGYTDPALVIDFIEKTNIDALAVAIGTAHGKYTKPPVLDIELLKQIKNVSSRPLVLHGGSGLSETDFNNVISSGIRKINICTEMCIAAHNAYTDGKQSGFEKSINSAKDAVKEIVKNKMRLFGSSQKA